MTSTTYQFNTKSLKLKEKDVFEDWQDCIFENDGQFQKDDQYMMFDLNGTEVVVFFDLNVSGSISHDDGDYWTPSHTEIDIEDVDVNLTSIFIDDYEVQLNESVKSQFKSLIKNNL